MFLWDSNVFGPISSRRLGNSLGINVQPINIKLCSFNCVYCECGWNKEPCNFSFEYIVSSKLVDSIEKKLICCKKENISIDSITFSGNGEPTLHPEFDIIIDKLIVLRNKYYPQTIITCLSNATQLNKVKVKEALYKIEKPVLKLDAGTEEMFKLINKPTANITLSQIVDEIASFQNDLTIQTLLFSGFINNKEFNNYNNEEIDAYVNHLEKIKPIDVMLYSLDRETPETQLYKADKQLLKVVADKIRKHNFKVTVY